MHEGCCHPLASLELPGLGLVSLGWWQVAGAWGGGHRGQPGLDQVAAAGCGSAAPQKTGLARQCCSLAVKISHYGSFHTQAGLLKNGHRGWWRHSRLLGAQGAGWVEEAGHGDVWVLLPGSKAGPGCVGAMAGLCGSMAELWEPWQGCVGAMAGLWEHGRAVRAMAGLRGSMAGLWERWQGSVGAWQSCGSDGRALWEPQQVHVGKRQVCVGAWQRPRSMGGLWELWQVLEGAVAGLCGSYGSSVWEHARPKGGAVAGPWGSLTGLREPGQVHAGCGGAEGARQGCSGAREVSGAPAGWRCREW